MRMRKKSHGNERRALLSNLTVATTEGFFEKVQTIDTRYAAIIGTNDFIFLVLRGEADANSDFFNDKKIEIIKSIVGNQIDDIIEGAYEVKSNVSSSTFNSYLQLIRDVKGE